MIKILTNNKEEYEIIKSIVEENKDKLEVDLKRPQDSIAPVVWSIDDVRDKFPEGTPDEVIEQGFLKIEKTLKESMTATGWDVIDELEDYILSSLE